MIMSMKKSIDTIRNQTHDLSVCSTVPQATAPQRAQLSQWFVQNIDNLFDISQKVEYKYLQITVVIQLLSTSVFFKGLQMLSKCNV
jgi:hypothetical protein